METKSCYYDLFEYFHKQHGLILVDTEIQDIIRAVEDYQKKLKGVENDVPIQH